MGLTRADIVLAALDHVAETGLEGLSMRALARRLGCDPMALYHHVKSKDALLDAMAEHLERGEAPPTSTDDWRADLRDFALGQLETAIRHPEAIPLFALRRSENPETVAIRQWLDDRVTASGTDHPHGRQLITAGINGVLLYYFALRRVPGSEVIAGDLIVEMVDALCVRLAGR